MCSSLKDYKPIPGYEKFYTLNKIGTIRSLDREINNRGKKLILKQNPVKPFKVRSVLYAILRDENYKDRKINITKIIKNVFGRQTPIIIKTKIKEKPKFVKPINHTGSRGIKVEQWDENKLLKVFDNFASAARAVGGEYRHVSDTCYGKRKFYAGYKWKFHEPLK